MPSIPFVVEVTAQEFLRVVGGIDLAKEPVTTINLRDGFANLRFSNGLLAEAVLSPDIVAGTAEIFRLSLFRADTKRLAYSVDPGLVIGFDLEVVNADAVDGLDIELTDAVDLLDADAYLAELRALETVLFDLAFLDSLNPTRIAFGDEDGPDLEGRFDTLDYGVARDEIEVTLLEDGSVELVSAPVSDAPVTATVTGLDRLQLEDGAYLYGLGEGAELVYLLYAGLLQRTPDAEGLRFWAGRVENGLAPRALAQDFAMAPEFEQAFGGAPDTLAFVETLYDRVLGREADDDGRTFWVERLDSGRYTEGDMLLFFAGSTENRGRAAADIQNGFWVDDIDLA